MVSLYSGLLRARGTWYVAFCVHVVRTCYRRPEYKLPTLYLNACSSSVPRACVTPVYKQFVNECKLRMIGSMELQPHQCLTLENWSHWGFGKHWTRGIYLRKPQGI
jgi:hypothetical protein